MSGESLKPPATCLHCAYQQTVDRRQSALDRLYAEGAPMREAVAKFLEKIGLAQSKDR